jgi:hypothetical protein
MLTPFGIVISRSRHVANDFSVDVVAVVVQLGCQAKRVFINLCTGRDKVPCDVGVALLECNVKRRFASGAKDIRIFLHVMHNTHSKWPILKERFKSFRTMLFPPFSLASMLRYFHFFSPKFLHLWGTRRTS